MNEENAYGPSSPFGGKLDALLRDRRELHVSTLERSRQYWAQMKTLLEERSSDRAQAMLEDVNQALHVLNKELERRREED